MSLKLSFDEPSDVPGKMTELTPISIYTDGSCNPNSGAGGWAAILCVNHQKFTLQGKEDGTTHQRMELMAALRALEHLKRHRLLRSPIVIFTDSQYLLTIPNRRNKLLGNKFLTKQGKVVRNHDLIQSIIAYLDQAQIDLVKVVAHQKKTSTENLNREVDKLARSIVRRQDPSSP